MKQNRFNEIRWTTHSKIYKRHVINSEYGGCFICLRRTGRYDGGCNSYSLGRKPFRNWKSYRKTQYREVGKGYGRHSA